jgi:hypothetical protein
MPEEQRAPSRSSSPARNQFICWRLAEHLIGLGRDALNKRAEYLY